MTTRAPCSAICIAIALPMPRLEPAQCLEHQFGLSPRHMLARYAAHYRERCVIGADAVRMVLEHEDDHSPLQDRWAEVVRHNECELSLTSPGMPPGDRSRDHCRQCDAGSE